MTDDLVAGCLWRALKEEPENNERVLAKQAELLMIHG